MQTTSDCSSEISGNYLFFLLVLQFKVVHFKDDLLNEGKAVLGPDLKINLYFY